jgi:protein subunit release factor B
LSKIDLQKLSHQIRFEVFTSGGPGGQHANKTASSVRAIHDPTGIWAIARDHRSQYRNRLLAQQRLLDKLVALQHRPRSRIASSIPHEAHERRLRSKQHRSHQKILRGRVDGED